MWLARVHEYDGLFGSGYTNRGLKRAAVALEHSHTATMAFGSLALQVHTVRAAPTVSLYYNVVGQPGRRQWDDHVLRIWPVPTIPLEWPPGKAISQAGEVAAFAQRFDPPEMGAA